jgi:hypothetical protein
MASGTRKPTAVAIIFGVLNLIGAALGLCAICAGTVGLLVMANTPDPALQEVMTPNVKFATGVGIALDGISTILILIAGIGLVMGARWGKAASIGWASFRLPSLALEAFLHFAYVLPDLRQLLAKVNNAEAEFQIRLQMISTVVGFVIAAGYALLLLTVCLTANLTKGNSRPLDEGDYDDA